MFHFPYNYHAFLSFLVGFSSSLTATILYVFMFHFPHKARQSKFLVSLMQASGWLLFISDYAEVIHCGAIHTCFPDKTLATEVTIQKTISYIHWEEL